MKTLTRTTENRTEHNRKMVESYPIQVSALPEEEGGGFQALFPPLARSAVGYGATPQEAIADLQKVVPLFLKMMDKTEQTLPEIAVEKEWDDFSGKFNVRVAKVLHAQLVELAEDQGISLNSLVQTILASGLPRLPQERCSALWNDARLRQSRHIQVAEGEERDEKRLMLKVPLIRTQKRWQTRRAKAGFPARTPVRRRWRLKPVRGGWRGGRRA